MDMIEQAVAALQAGNLGLAEKLCRSLLSKDRNQFGPYLLLGVIHAQRGELTEALTALRRAVKLNPNSADAYVNLGRVQFDLGDRQHADESYRKALLLDPRSLVGLSNYAIVLRSSRRLHEALALCDRALAIRPDYSPAQNNRGNILFDLRRFEEAREAYQAALKTDPASSYTKGDLLNATGNICYWNDPKLFADVIDDIKAGRGSHPFALLATPATPTDQLRSSSLYVKDRFPATSVPLPFQPPRASHDRIRIAYISGDFRDHAVPVLLIGALEHHDRSKFTTVGISLLPESQTAIGQRIKEALDEFHDVSGMNDLQIAKLLRTLRVDIAVDLAGHTELGRPGIFALRPTKVQVNYLGYPGTMGADYYDYIIGDSVVMPSSHDVFYSEKIVRLPDTYQPNDRVRKIADVSLSRAEANLPETGFVFCCFNNSFKITPDIFNVWTRLLTKVDGSVLWLLATNEAAQSNLRKEAEARGINSERIVFAPRASPEDHLARHRLADLFVDTLYYNAHTTASDALWAGLPLITIIGQTFASRVAASLLTAAELPELVTMSLEDYEALALELARNPERLAAIKAKLQRDRLKVPLFDTERYTRHLEAAYTTMWQRVQRGEPPESFAVDPLS